MKYLMFSFAFFMSLSLFAANAGQIKYKGEGFADLLQKISATYIVNYDTTSLENIVKAAVSDQDIAFVTFYDMKNKAIVEVTPEPKNLSQFYVFERSVKSHDGSPVATMKLGLKKKK